jgi:hypothetical protein
LAVMGRILKALSIRYMVQFYGPPYVGYCIVGYNKGESVSAVVGRIFRAMSKLCMEQVYIPPDVDIVLLALSVQYTIE